MRDLSPASPPATRPAPDPWDRAIAALSQGRPVALTDEVRGVSDLVLSAAHTTGDAINFLVTHARGLLGLALPAERVARLRLPPMAASWDAHSKPFTVSIEARDGVSTGISAPERACTIRVATAPDARPDQLVSPGHVFPLRARPGGLLAGGGRVEAALALGAAAGSPDGAVVMEVLDDEGAVAGGDYVRALCARFGLCQLTIAAVARQARAAALIQLEARGASPAWRRGLAWAENEVQPWR